MAETSNPATNSDDPQPSASAAIAVTVAAASNPHPPPHTLTLALPIQNPSPNPNPNPSDSWSDGATSALIDAWGERYLHLRRGNLKQPHWQEVADAVSARENYAKAPKSDVQCKNRIDTLKKKYKSEKSKLGSGQSRPSTWPYFHRLDILIGPTLLKPPPPPAAKAAFPPQFPQKTRTQTIVNSVSVNVKKRPRSPAAAAEGEGDGEGDGWGLLARAVLGFGEVYERVERGKTMQAVEIEKQRMRFFKEIEVQRMEFLVKAQMEISTLDRRLGERSHRRHRRSSNDDANGGSDK